MRLFSISLTRPLAMTLALAAALTGAFAAGARAAPLEGIHKIQHVVVIMQENRSFDSYFGTFPGANGIPAGVCAPDPLTGACVTPFHDPYDENYGGPHGHGAFTKDLAEGKMNGFVEEAAKGSKCDTTAPNCSPCTETQTAGATEEAGSQCIDVMGYHDAREIPNYWMYAENFVLQDDMFEPNSSWSWPEHLYLVSGWSATCIENEKWSENPLSCSNSIEGPPNPETGDYTGTGAISLPWTDITYLLHKYGVSWRYYIFEGDEPDCEDDEAMTCAPVTQGPFTYGIWNPLVDFADVQEDGQLGDVQSLTNFFTAVHETGECGLPNVSWITPNSVVSEHPPALVSKGQAYVTTLINSIMRSPCWGSTAIFLSWDDWGGFYDHVVPPVIDSQGYGFRVPGLVISPYAKTGYIDNQQLSHDAYLRFIENDFLGGQTLNPATDGRPDSRPTVREEAPGLGNLEADFEFNQAPRAPLILSPEPAPGPASTPPFGVTETAPPIAAPPATTTTPAPAPTTPDTTSPPPTPLQIFASVAPRQDVKLTGGRIYLMLGCNVGCSLSAGGHLSLREDGEPLTLQSARKALAAHHTTSLVLSLPPSALATVRRALEHHQRIVASVQVQARSAGRPSKRYDVHIRLTWS